MFNWLKEIFSSNSQDDQVIDYFQLEGLIRNQVPFVMLDLSGASKEQLKPAIKNLLRDSQTVAPNQVETYLREKQISEIQPVVLVCLKGKQSKKIARDLMKKSWLNVYAVTGGLEQLEKDS